MLSDQDGRSYWENLINERIIGKNAFRDRQILIDSLLDGYTYEWIAEVNDLSVRQVARIMKERRKQLYK